MNNLMAKLPFYYYKSKVATDITNVQQQELDSYDDFVTTTLNQFYIKECDTHIYRYEKELDIKVEESKDIEFRRSVIISKLRGAGTTTIDMIKNVAKSYTNGDVDVIEDNDNYKFVIKFINILGIPANLDDLVNAIEEVKPAHLECVYEFKYNTHTVLSKFTHSELSKYTHMEIREEELHGN